jgi:transcriptional regulator with XRE-family HTH domain
MMNNFATWLNDFMDQGDLTQEALAQKLGISHVAISKWQRSLNLPEPRQLRNLAEVAGQNPIELFQLCGYLPFQLPKQPKRILRPKMLAILMQLENMDDLMLDLVADQIRAVKAHAKHSSSARPAAGRRKRTS